MKSSAQRAKSIALRAAVAWQMASRRLLRNSLGIIEDLDQSEEPQYNGTPRGCLCFILFSLLNLGEGLAMRAWRKRRRTRTCRPDKPSPRPSPNGRGRRATCKLLPYSYIKGLHDGRIRSLASGCFA